MFWDMAFNDEKLPSFVHTELKAMSLNFYWSSGLMLFAVLVVSLFSCCMKLNLPRVLGH